MVFEAQELSDERIALEHELRKKDVVPDHPETLPFALSEHRICGLESLNYLIFFLG
jgi:hypothetical protein